jgi:predicted transcriptional regulator of viral defense system
MEKTHTGIERSLSRKKPADLVFASDFKGNRTEAAIRKSLSRLTGQGVLKRVAHGIYYIPKKDPVLGELYPSAEDVASKIAEKERVYIHPTGFYALNKPGLSTQVPTKLVYITDGVQRLLTIGKMKV